MKKRIVLATRSHHKAAEIERILAGRHIELITLTDARIEPSSAEDEIENQETFLANARAKAGYFAQVSGLPVLADDSGLEVVALNNAPGVRTKRFAIDAGIDAAGADLDRANNALLLERMSSVPDEQRAARYVCAAAYATMSRHVISALGTCTGAIAREPRGNGGFGYDPLFYIPDLQVTFAELSAAQKDQRSHRARAFRALANLL